MKIPTLDTEGRPNGYIITCWNANERPELRPDQVYVTAIAPRSRKGPHLHMRRRGVFLCISGSVKVRTRRNGMFIDRVLSPEDAFPQIVLPGVPCALYNYGDTEALVLNMPSPAWSAEDPDDHPALDWKDPDDWPQPRKVTCPACQGSGGSITNSRCANCDGKGTFYAKA
jgi:hypothetical protein